MVKENENKKTIEGILWKEFDKKKMIKVEWLKCNKKNVMVKIGL